MRAYILQHVWKVSVLSALLMLVGMLCVQPTVSDIAWLVYDMFIAYVFVPRDSDA